MEIINDLQIVIVGKGRLAHALQNAFRSFATLLVNSRTFEGMDSLSDAKKKVFFIAVSDDAIESVTRRIIDTYRSKCQGAYFVHLSGALSSTLFEKCGVVGASMHPAISVSAQTNFSDVLFALEGQLEVIQILEDFISDFGARSFQITAEQKLLYHVASVMSANFSAVIAKEALSLFLKAGIDSMTSQELLLQLQKSATDSIRTSSYEDGITGPAARGDANVLNLHREVLRSEKELLHVYDAMTALIERRVRDKKK